MRTGVGRECRSCGREHDPWTTARFEPFLRRRVFYAGRDSGILDGIYSALLLDAREAARCEGKK